MTDKFIIYFDIFFFQVCLVFLYSVLLELRSESFCAREQKDSSCSENGSGDLQRAKPCLQEEPSRQKCENGAYLGDQNDDVRLLKCTGHDIYNSEYQYSETETVCRKPSAHRGLILPDAG